jgi:hypothetical protein
MAQSQSDPLKSVVRSNNLAAAAMACDGLLRRMMKSSYCITAGLLLAGALQAQQPALSLDRASKGVRLGLQGQVGHGYSLEATSDTFGANAWTSLLTFTQTNSAQGWFDVDASSLARRFYRLVKLDDSAFPVMASDFRLIDHTGQSRELYYQATDTAIVLVFMDTRCAEFAQLAASIKSLRDQFQPGGVTFWMIDSGAGASRSNLVSAAQTQAVDLPILHDAAQIVARAFHASVVPEAVAISTLDWTVFYRGALQDSAGNISTAQNYLAGALGSFLANATVSPSRTLAKGCTLDLVSKPNISYSADIAPLLLDKCVRCHNPGNIAPWSMVNYSSIQTNSLAIKDRVLTGKMPPWHADPNYGVFANDISLKPEQAAALIQWIEDGAPRGDGPDPVAASQPPPTNYPYAWPASLGQPDFIVNVPAYNVPATGEVAYKYPQVSVTLPSNVWLRAAVILPGNTEVVHHSLAFLGTQFDVFLSGAGLNGFFAGYVPGYDAVAYPPTTGKYLAKNTTLTFQMHYTTTGTARTDRTKLGLYYASGPPQLSLQTHAAATLDISIQPGDSNYTREASATPSASKDVWLYELSPHMHYRGSWFKFEALYPAGTSEILLSVPHYEFHWQSLYRLAQPKRLPAGTVIRCTGGFDNSAQNPDNPNPGASVSFGEQTDDEMFIGYFNFAEIP